MASCYLSSLETVLWWFCAWACSSVPNKLPRQY